MTVAFNRQKNMKKSDNRYVGMFMSQTQVSYDNPNSIIYDKKFDTAIRTSYLHVLKSRYDDKVLTTDDKLIFDSKLFNESFSEEALSIRYDIVSRVFLQIYDKTSHKNLFEPHKHDHYRNLQQIVKTNTEIQITYILSNYELLNKGNIFQKIHNYWDNYEITPLIRNLMSMASWLSYVIELTNNLDVIKRKSQSDEDYLQEALKVNHLTCPYISLTIVWSKNYTYIIVDNQYYILPKVALLMIQNKICDMISVLLLALFSEGNTMPERSYRDTVEFILELAHLSSRHQKNFFLIVKCLESFVVAETIIEVDNWDNSGFLQSITDDLFAKTAFDYHSSKLRCLLTQASIPFRHELGCLTKIMGHPLVDMKEGSQKIYDKTTETYTLSRAAIQQCICNIKENYVRNHIAKHRKWPPHEIIHHAAPDVLKRASLLNKDPLSLEMRKYGEMNILDWEFVELKKNMTFNKMENAIPYLKDKTITILRSGVISKYINFRNDTQTDPQIRWQDTRLLLAYLVHPSAVLDHTKYIDGFADADTFTHFLDYLVCRIVPKEKELKPEYRGFGCKTYEDRMRCLVQEKNVMQFLDEYCDEQAMTLDELSLVRKLHSFRRLTAAYTQHRVIYVNIDASAWNNHFRKETVDDVMTETLDKIFGYAIFSKTMQAYQHTLFYVPDVEGTYYWTGQDGGIEGLNQDTWVVVYLGQIKTAVQHLHRRIRVHVLCKGDDLRIAIVIPGQDLGTQSISSFKTQIVTSISETARTFGHEIKVEDSYGSEKYFSFSKEASVGVIELPQTMRKIQKCYGANNAFLASIDEYIGATFANAHSASRTSPYPLSSYLVGLTWMYYYLLADPLYRTVTEDGLIALGLIPNMLGGFPIIYLHNFFVRCESDLLPPFLGLLEHCQAFYPNVHHYMSNFCCVEPNSTSWEKVYADPYSLSVNIPTKPTQKLKRYVEPVLKNITKNDIIKELLAASHSEEDNMCVHILDSLPILPAKTASILYSCFPRSVVKELTDKFESARSINQLLLTTFSRYKVSRILRTIVKAEAKLQEWRHRILINGHTDHLHISFIHLKSSCPAEYADRIRQYSWGKPVEEVTMPPLQHLIKYTTQTQAQFLEWDLYNHFEYRYSLAHTSLPYSTHSWHHFESGGVTPFIGATTSTAVEEPKIHFAEKDVLLTKLRSLVELRTWVNTTSTQDGIILTSNIGLFIDKLLSLYTNRPETWISPFGGRRIRGCRQHHLRGINFRASIVPNNLSNIYQQITGRIDSHRRYQDSSANYLVNFLHIFCHSTCVTSLELGFSFIRTTPIEFWTVTRDCHFCNHPISETPIIINERLLRHLHMNPLQATIISETSERIMRQAILDNPQTIYRAAIAPDTIDVEIAAIAILNEFVYASVRQSQTIKSRYTEHALTGTALEVLGAFLLSSRKIKIPSRDLKKIPHQTISDVISQIVFTQITQKATYTPTCSLDSFIGSIPVTEAPWYSLCLVLVETGLIRIVIPRLSSALNMPIYVNYHSAEQATAYLGQLCMDYALTQQIKTPLVIVTDKDEVEMMIDIQMYLRSYSWYVLHNDYISWKTDDPSFNKLTCIRALVFLMLEIWNENNIRIQEIENITTNNIPLTTLIGLDDAEDVRNRLWDFLDDVDDADQNFHVLIPYVCKKFNLKVDDIRQMDLSYEEILDHCEHVLTQSRHLIVDIWIVTLVDCINVMTSRTFEVEDPIEKVHVVDADPVILGEVRHLNRHPEVCMIPRHLEHNNPTTLQSIAPEYDFTKLYLGNNFNYRIIGYCNTSATVIFEIYEVLFEYQVGSIKNLSISCLADGVGSLTATLAALHPQSKVLYNTFQERNTPSTSPDIAISQHHINRCEFVYDHINLGVYDLRNPHTLIYYQTLMPTNHIVTCDAENVGITSEVDLTIIWENVCNYFINTRTRNGILIMRLDLRYLSSVLRVMTYLISYGCQIYLLAPNCHSRIISFYIIAVTKQYIIGTNEYDHLPQQAISENTINLMKRWVEYGHTRHTKIDPVLGIYMDIKPAYGRYHTWSMISDPLYLSYCQMHLHKLLPYPDFTQRYNTLVEYINHANISFIPEIKYIMDHLTTGRRHVTFRDNTYNLDTLAHRRALIRWWFRLQGFEYTMFEYKKNPDHARIYQRELRQMFLLLISQLPYRDRSNIPIVKEIYTSEYHTGDNIRFAIYKDFLAGVRFGVCCIAGLAIRATINARHQYDDIDP